VVRSPKSSSEACSATPRWIRRSSCSPRGPAPIDWHGLFAPLTPDTAGKLDGAGDPNTLPSLDDEPEVLRADVARLTDR